MSYIIDVKRTEQGGAEPVTLTEAKTQLRVTFTDDDTEITAIIARARRHIEDYCNISITDKSIIFTGYLSCEWRLPYGPVKAVQSVATNSGPTGSGPVVYSTATTSWGIDGDVFTQSGASKYRITYLAGFDVVPAALKAAILCEIAYLYENRGKEDQKFATAESGVCPEAMTLCNPYRVIWI